MQTTYGNYTVKIFKMNTSHGTKQAQGHIDLDPKQHMQYYLGRA